MLIGDKTKHVFPTLVTASLLMAAWTAGGQVPDALPKAFADPPMYARPRVWWHWVNGNITQEGIRKDLEWMQRFGIAGM